jgi:hypothetical protein
MRTHPTVATAAASYVLSILLIGGCSGTHTEIRPATSAAIRAGTSVVVRVSDAISTESAIVGTPFVGVLESGVRDSGGTEIAPAGAKAFGRVVDSQGGGAVKEPRLAIALMTIETDGRRIPITTSPIDIEGGYDGGTRVEFKLSETANLR